MTRCLPGVIVLACVAQIQAAAAQDLAAPATLDPGQAIERPLAGGQTHTYRLPLDAGEVATLTVDQRGIDVVVRVRDAHDAVLAEFDLESRKDGHEPVIVVGDAAGPARISVSARYPKDSAASYVIHVDAVRPADDRDRDEFELHKLATAASDLETAGKFADALKDFTQALGLAEHALGPNDAYLGYLLARCGELSRTTGDTAAAERLFERAIAVDEVAVGRETPQTAYAILRQGALYTALNDYAKSEPLLDEGLAITERTLGPEHERVAQATLAVVMPHYFLHDYAYVVPRFEHALAIAEKTSDPNDFIITALLNNLGDVYTRMRQFEVAQPYSERALAGIEKRFGPDNWRVANPLINLGLIYRETGQFDRALEVSWRGYAIREKAFGPEHPDTAASLIQIGKAYHAKGDYPKAIETFNRALAILEARRPYFTYTTMALSDAARSYAAAGDIDHAIAYQARANRLQAKRIELNLSIGSEREKLLYVESIGSGDSTISIQAQIAPDNPTAATEAIGLLLQRKGQVFDALSGSLAALRQRMNAEDRAMLDQLGTVTSELATLALDGPGKTPLDAYKQQLAVLETRRDQLEADIGGRSLQFRAQSLPVTVAAVQEVIPDEAALIELALYYPLNVKAATEATTAGAPRYIAYVLRHDGGVQWKDLGDAHAIDEAVAALRQALRHPASRNLKTLARAVDEKVLAPLRPIVGDATRLLISPDGELNLMPFEVLVDEQGHYAVERFSISYLTSGRDLLRMQLSRPSKTAPLVVAAPSFGPALLAHRAQPVAKSASAGLASGMRHSVTTGPDLSVVYFAPLPGTAAEARTIKSLYPEATVLSGAHATKAALTHANAPALLHIATHGFFLQNASSSQESVSAGEGTPGTRAVAASTHVENPLLRAGLALSGANLKKTGSEEGILTALEASTLNLWGTRLVTLSGCDTGVGDVKNGEGIYGLRRAFLLAGAETLVMSLWPVSDYVTRDMMTAYYGGLKKGLGRGEALRQAQLAMLRSKENRHPFYWASFIQAGDWRPF
jgi:CHAT domain-containing protein/tetratricopeptide (TPR) repeat protein